MATAVLDETSVLLDEEDLFGSKANSANKGNFWDQLAYNLRLDGYDAIAVCDRGNEENVLKHRRQIALQGITPATFI